MAAFSEAQDTVNCTVCLETFKGPKVLPCLHTFCTGCLGRIGSSGRSTSPGAMVKQEVSVSTSSTLVCPQCRAEHAIPDGGVENFVTNFSIVGSVRSAAVKKQGTSVLCEECVSSEPAIAHCTQCSSYLCEYCSGAHKKMKRFCDHDVISLQDLDHEKLLPKPHPHPHHCPRHPKEVLNLYCKSCNVLVCCNCIVITHQGHTFGCIDEDTRTKVEEILEDLSYSAKETLTEFRRNLKYVNEVEKVTTGNATKLKDEINAVFDERVAALESHRASLLEEGENKYNTSVKSVWAQREYIEQKVEALSSTVRFTECLRQCDGDSEMLCLAAQAIPRLKEMKSMRWDPSTVSEVESRYTFLKSGTFLGKHDMERLGERSDPLDIVFSDNPPSDSLPDTVPLGMKKQLNLVVMRSLSKRPAVLREEVIVNIKFYGKTLPAEITQNQTGSWSVQFTPVCGGLHKVSAYIGESKSSKWTFIVAGKPEIGSRVCKGPHWNYSGIVELGTVIDNDAHDSCAPGYSLKVKWDGRDTNTFHHWRADEYDVQLVP